MVGSNGAGQKIRIQKSSQTIRRSFAIWPVNARKTARQAIARKPALYALRLTRSVEQGLVSRKSQLFIQS